LSRLIFLCSLCLSSLVSTALAEEIRLASQPALSPDGSTLAFVWHGEIWTVPIAGGAARPLTRHPARDREPKFSPDGKSVAFVSNREGSEQVYVMPLASGSPKQLTSHTAGYSLQEWSPDGLELLVSASRDHDWDRTAPRFFRIGASESKAEEILFDAAGQNGTLSADGKRLLLTREGAQWWRKGYEGSQASQIWLYDLASKAFTKVLDPPGGALWPLWKPDGSGFYYVGVVGKSWNLLEHRFGATPDRPLTRFEDDSIVFPCLSRDGSTLVFRHLFDLYALHPGKPGSVPTKLEIRSEGDSPRVTTERRVLTQASQVAFTKDGLEVAFIAGGDLWVMDTELLDPKQITTTPEEERFPAFSPDGSTLYFVSDQGGQADLWRADRGDSARDWWVNTKFNLTRLTQDADVESDLRWSPEGSKLGFIKGRGDLWTIGPDGKDARRVLAGWSQPEYDWSPDGKWLVYARDDDDFNSDVWVIPADGSKPPFNLSKHPDNESSPVWSPDGKVIAFTGRRENTEVDVYYVWLRAEDDEKTARDRSLEKAVDKIKKGRTKAATPAKPGAPAAKGARPDAPAAEEPKKPASPVAIDFDRIHERIRRISIPNSTEARPFWSPDSKRLAFTASIDGTTGVYSVEIPDDLKPKLISAVPGTQARWLETGNQIVWLSGGVPSSVVPAGGPALAGPRSAAGASAAAESSPAGGGRQSSYRFRALQELNWPAHYRAGFELAWRTMRDNWYDERLGNRNWDAVRRKYSDMAAASPDSETFATVVQLMLGELNGSHLGFIPIRTPDDPGTPPATPTPPGPRPNPPGPGGAAPAEGGRWQIVTPHLGLRFDPAHRGPGLKVASVIPDGPTDRRVSKVETGETVLTIDGTTVDPSMDLSRVLNGPIQRDIRLTVRGADGKDRDVLVRPIPYASLSRLLYEKWVKDNRKRVEEVSKGTLGYLHIRGMDFPSFYRFEEELYSAGAGKQGLIIDVRENGGGSTADHLLTALTQPAHATAVPRGGGPGYPQDRKVYATWSKPIVVLCNQNSFSNAEIFSHAIKTLKRGKLVGVPTAGGVISTGATTIMDLGLLRLPGRGWFTVNDGEDMELHGAVPDVILWPHPTDHAKGLDVQLDKAVEVLAADVEAERKRPKPKLRKATER
jgi:tricorn protease